MRYLVWLFNAPAPGGFAREDAPAETPRPRSRRRRGTDATHPNPRNGRRPDSEPPG
jgi:hypothetical protein